MTFEQENDDNSACRNDEDVDATTTNSTIRNSDMAIRITRPSFSASLECITEDHQTDYMCLTPSETNNNNNNYKNIKNAKYIRKGATPPPRRCQRITNLPPDWPPTEGKANRSLSAPNLPSSVSLRQRQASTRRSLRQASNNSLPEALHKKTSTNASFSSLCSDRHNGIQHSALNINNIMTWVSFILPACKDNSDTVILVIPGNPGAIEFYDRFIEHLFDKCNLPIFGISHAGHNLIPSKSLLVNRVYKEINPKVKSSDKHVFTLEEQITHKLAFIRQHIDPKKKIIIVAHSLGCYITLKMLDRLQREEESRVKQVVFLFPVFERTMETKSGRKWVPLTQFLHKPVIKTTKLVEMLPPSVKRSLVDCIASRRRFSITSKRSLSNGVDSLVTTNGLRNMSQIARDLSKIGSLGDLEGVIRHFRDKLTFYYGASDLWTPLSFYQEMKQRFPDVDIRLDGKGIGHAFVLNHSNKVAPIVSEIIREKVMIDEIAETGSIDSYRGYFFNFSFKRSHSYKSGKNSPRSSFSKLNHTS